MRLGKYQTKIQRLKQKINILTNLNNNYCIALCMCSNLMCRQIFLIDIEIYLRGNLLCHSDTQHSKCYSSNSWIYILSNLYHIGFQMIEIVRAHHDTIHVVLLLQHSHFIVNYGLVCSLLDQCHSHGVPIFCLQVHPPILSFLQGKELFSHSTQCFDLSKYQ